MNNNWKVLKDSSQAVVVDAETNETVAICGLSSYTKDAERARLIAAAPELLEVLTLALPYVEDCEADTAYKAGAVAKMVRRMMNAIADATGEKT